jgi:hypothetical protein
LVREWRHLEEIARTGKEFGFVERADLLFHIARIELARELRNSDLAIGLPSGPPLLAQIQWRFEAVRPRHHGCVNSLILRHHARPSDGAMSWFKVLCELQFLVKALQHRPFVRSTFENHEEN